MVKTRGSQQVKSYASKLAMRVPELKKFFSAKGQKSKEKPKEKQVAKVKRRAGSAKGSSSVPKQQLNISQRDPAVIAASVMGTMRQSSSTLSKPKVMICLGDHVIDTESEPSLIQPAAFYRKRPADTLPDYFDPSIRPSVPTNNQQIYIPGNKVYARWLDKDDPGSYGTVSAGPSILFRCHHAVLTLEISSYCSCSGTQGLSIHPRLPPSKTNTLTSTTTVYLIYFITSNLMMALNLWILILKTL